MALKQSNKLLMFSLLAGTAIGLIAFSPTIYAIVEPHITINMDPGQTTKPFVINDTATNTEVFSVDVDGSIKSANVVILHFEQTGVIPIPQNQSLTNLKELAVWQVVKEPGVSDNFIILFEESLTGNFRTVNGTGTAFLGFFSSNDRINWGLEEVAGASGTTFVVNFAGLTNDVSPLNTQFLAFGLYTTNASTNGEARDISGTYIVILPVGYSLERIL